MIFIYMIFEYIFFFFFSLVIYLEMNEKIYELEKLVQLLEQKAVRVQEALRVFLDQGRIIRTGKL